jgi:hypothetical protein
MAETLEAAQTGYEPKRKFQWKLEIDGIDAFTGRTASRPKQQFESTTVDFINTKQYFAGKAEWQTLDIELVDPISPSASQKVTDWLRLIYDYSTGRMGYAEFYKKNFSIKLLDGPGNVIEKWNCIGGWPMDIDFGDLDYKDSEVLTVKFKIRADAWIQEF